MNRAEKEAFVSEMGDKFARFKGAIVVDYRGLTVAELTSLRRDLRAVDGDLKIVKNRLCLRAMKSLEGVSGVEKHFEGTTAVVFGYSDPVPPAKVIKQFIKANEKMSIKMGLLPGSVLTAEDVNELALLASREETIAKLLGLLNSLPTKLVQTLAAVPQNFAMVLEAYRQKKDQGK